MEDDPVPLIKKRQARHLRAAGRTRVGEDDGPGTPAEASTDGSRPGTPDVSPSTLATKLKKKNKLATRLSFGGDEEEGPVFNVKKSTLSRNVSLREHPNLSTDGTPATPAASQRPAYTAAELASLKANTPTTALRGKARNPIVLDDDEDSAGAAGSGMDDATYEHLMGKVDDMEIDTVNGTTVTDDMAIPTDSHIAAAREKRTAARKLPILSKPEAPSFANEDDYISLDVSRPFGERKEKVGPHPESRLMREDDEIGEGDDEAAEYTGAQERIALGKKAREKEAQKRRAGLVEVIDEAEADSDDSESREWELAQVRRAAPARLSPPPEKKRETYYAPPIPAVTPIPTLAAQQARLSSLLEDLTGRHLQNTKALDGIEKERDDVITNEVRVRREVEEVGTRWGEARALREWVEALAEFLDVKFPTLEKLEEEHISLLSERAGIVNQRRKEDDSDDVALFLGIPRARLLSDDQTEVTDELGRAPPDDSAYSATRRARRLARMNRRISRPPRTTGRQRGREEEEGFSTDSDLMPGENADLLAALSDLSNRVSSLLSDVRSEEFKDPRKGVGRRFGAWRDRSREEYENAWGGLAAVGAWEFWARLEMAGWDPLDDDRSLDSFHWYDALYQYSRPREHDDDPMEEPPLGPDGDLVSSLVSSAIVPRLCTLISSGAFDPYSTSHVRRMVELTEQVEACIGRESEKFRLTCRTVLYVFSNEITATLNVIAPLLADGERATFDPSAIPARKRYLTRRLKLLSNLLLWRKYAGGGEVDIDRLLGQIMTPIGIAGWDVGGEEILRKAAAMVPSQLVPVKLTARLA